MMSKEKRAELQALLDGHSNGHPLWRTFGDDETDIGRVRGHQSIRGFHGDTLGSFYTAELATLATEAVNALQELLDTLDVTERALATAREDASEMEKKAIAEGSEALALRAEVAALKAAAQWRPMDTAPRDGEAILAVMPHRQIYDVSCYENEGDEPWCDSNGHWHGTNDFVGWMPIPALPSGDGQ